MAETIGIIGTVISILSIAYTVGSMIFGPRGHTTNVEGSRLGDLAVTASTYGVVQPIAFGTVRVAGNVIWGTPIKETKSSQVHRAGKSSKHSPSTRQITYSYSSTFALALTRGIASGVVRIWANSTLVYDATGGSDTVNAVGFNFRFYPGDGNQLPDSLIEADKGVGNVPGHRGLCYLVFDDIPLVNYGNRIPNLSVELSFGAAIDQATQALSPAHSVTLGDMQPDAIAFNPLTLRAYVATKAPAGIVEFDLTTMQVFSEHKMSAMFNEAFWDATFLGSTLWIGADQRLNILTGPFVYSVDVNTFTSPVKTAVGTGFDTALLGGPLVVLGPKGLETYTIVSGGNLPDVRILELGTKLTSTGTITAYAPSIPFDMSGITYACSFDGRTSPNAYIQAISVEVHPDAILGVLAYTRIAKIAIVATLQATTFDATATGFYNIGCFFFNSLDYTVIAMFTTWNGGGITGFEIGTSWLAKINPGNSQIIWKTQFAGSANVLTMFNSDIRSDRLAFMGGNVVYTYDLSNGALISAVNWAGFSGIYANTQLYTGIGNCLIVPTLDGLSWTKLYLGRLKTSTSLLSDIVSQICLASGLLSSDFDVTQLTGIVIRGFAVSQRTTAADIMKPLLEFFQVDVIESDYKIMFQPRGGPVVTTINESALIRNNKSQTGRPEAYSEVRTQEIDLPVRFTVTYLDETASFQTNTQMAKRPREPYPTVFSDQQLDLQLGLVLNPDTAAQQAEKLLYSYWLERNTFKVILPMDYIWLNSADPVIFTLNSGYTVRTRLGNLEIGADNTIVTNLITEDGGDYTGSFTTNTNLTATYVATANGVLATLTNNGIGVWTINGHVTALNDVISVANQTDPTQNGLYVVTTAGAVGVAGVLTLSGAGQYVSTLPGQPATGTVFVPVFNPLPSRLFILDIPLLRDTDDLNGIGIRGYWAAAPYTHLAWQGAQLQGSQDQQSWSAMDTTIDQVSYGFLETALPDALSSFHIHDIETVVVNMFIGGDLLASVDEITLANGYNAAAVFKANGEIEIIQFLTVTVLGLNRYQLTGLARGRRGTDTMAAGHASAELFMILRSQTVLPLAIPQTARNMTGYYRAVTALTQPQEAVTQQDIFHGRDQMPYAPVSPVATITGSDIVITFHRRSRVNGALHDLDATVPLGEGIQQFQIDIWHADLSAVYRTLTTSTESATYLAANITSDFGSIPANLSISMYQISSSVGRGFSRIDTIGVS